MATQQGQFVEVRGRPWLVDAVDDSQPDLTTLRLSCIADDAQGEQIEVLWDAEIGGGRKGSRAGIWFPWEFSAGTWKFLGLSCFELRHIKSEVAEPETCCRAWRRLSWLAQTWVLAFMAGSADDATENGGDTF